MKKLAYLLSLVALTGCADLTTEIPMWQMQSPETLGKPGRFTFGDGYGRTEELTVVSDASIRPPNLNYKRRHIAEFYGRIGLGLSEKLDLQLRTGLINRTPYVLSGKYQLLGDPSLTAKAENFSLSVVAGLGYNSYTKSGDQNGALGRGGYRWKGTLNTYYNDVALPLGYRVADRVLLYGGPWFAYFSTTSKIEQDRSDDGQSAGGYYESSRYGRALGANFATRVNPTKKPELAFTLEVNYVNFRYHDLELFEELFVNGGVDLTF